MAGYGPRGETVTVVAWVPHDGDAEMDLKIEVFAAAGTTSRTSKYVSAKQRAEELVENEHTVLSVTTLPVK